MKKIVPENHVIYVSDYGDLIAQTRDMELVLYKELGSYQGEYIAILKDGNDIVIYRDYYGSCNGCDFLNAEGECTNQKNEKGDYLYRIGYKVANEHAQQIVLKARLPISVYNELNEFQKRLLLASNIYDIYSQEINEITFV